MLVHDQIRRLVESELVHTHKRCHISASFEENEAILAVAVWQRVEKSRVEDAVGALVPTGQLIGEPELNTNVCSLHRLGYRIIGIESTFNSSFPLVKTEINDDFLCLGGAENVSLCSCFEVAIKEGIYTLRLC